MITDQSLQLKIDELLIKENDERNALHEPSGKLSASWLFYPTRWQVMKTIGVPRKPIEPYVLGKFRRGEQAEDYVVDRLEKIGILKEKQKLIEYRNAMGLGDTVIDSDALFCKKGIIPLEIKSMTNAKLARINKGGEVDYHYKLQGGFYGLGMGTDFYGIGIVSAEDLRIDLHIFETKEIKPDIDRIITKYDDAVKYWETAKELPTLEFDNKVSWVSNLTYAPFEEKYINMTDIEIAQIVKINTN